MTSPTRGHNKSHSRRPIKSEQIRALLAMRRRGMTCEEVAKQLGLGESTVARYSSAWFQKHGNKHHSRQPKAEKTTKVTKTAQPKQAAKPKQQLSNEQVDYINKIYSSGNYSSGTFIGNLFIRIGKFFGGHHSV